MSPAKDLYFFDRYYGKGIEWYARQFDETARTARIVGEVCHDYLYGACVPRRILKVLGTDIRLLVSLREPVARAESAYRHLLRHGEVDGGFRIAVKKFPELVTKGLYAKNLARFFESFPAEAFFVETFDALESDPEGLATKLYHWLGVDDTWVPSDVADSRNPSQMARSVTVGRIVKAGARLVRRLGHPRIVGSIKSSPAIQRVLYTRHSEMLSARIQQDVIEQLQSLYRSDVRRLEAMTGLPVTEMWGYG